MISLILPVLGDLETGDNLPSRRGCLEGRKVEVLLGCGTCVMFVITLLSGIMAYLNTAFRGVGSYFRPDLGTQILLISVCIVSCLICICLVFGACKIECDRPYVGTGKDVKGMQKNIEKIEAQVDELGDIRDKTEASRGLFSKMYHKAVGQQREDRHEAKQLLSTLKEVAKDFVDVTNVIEKQGKEGLTGHFLQQIKSQVDQVVKGQILSEDQKKRMKTQVGLLKGLLKNEQTSLKQLSQTSEQEKKVLKENEKLLQQLSSLKNGGNLEGLQKALGKYETASKTRADMVVRLEEATIRYTENLEKEEKSTEKLRDLLSMARHMVDLKNGRDKLSTLIKGKPTVKELDKAIKAHIEFIDGLLPVQNKS